MSRGGWRSRCGLGEHYDASQRLALNLWRSESAFEVDDVASSRGVQE
jgi:hypothetical protein